MKLADLMSTRRHFLQTALGLIASKLSRGH